MNGSPDIGYGRYNGINGGGDEEGSETTTLLSLVRTSGQRAI